jgi:hypothetical protein
LRWQGIEARHADTEADLFFVAEDNYKCSTALGQPTTDAEKNYGCRSAFRRPLLLQIFLLHAVILRLVCHTCI